MGKNTTEKQKLHFLISLLPVGIATVLLLRSQSIVSISPPIILPTRAPNRWDEEIFFNYWRGFLLLLLATAITPGNDADDDDDNNDDHHHDYDKEKGGVAFIRSTRTNYLIPLHWAFAVPSYILQCTFRYSRSCSPRTLSPNPHKGPTQIDYRAAQELRESLL